MLQSETLPPLTEDVEITWEVGQAGPGAGLPVVTEAGATSTRHTETAPTIATLTAEATPPAKGIKTVTLGTDGTHPTPNSLHLG